MELAPLKALVWFWIIDETLVLTSILSVCRLNEVGTCQVMEHDDHGDDGDDHKAIKCSTWKRRKRKTKPYGDQSKGIA